VVPSNRTKGNGRRLKHEKFHLNRRVIEQWNRTPPSLGREVVESPSLEIFKTQLGTAQSSLP